jgi:exonuclease VII small subunit
MIDFANRVEPEIPIYINNFEKGIDSFSKLVTIYINDFENKDNEIKEAIDSLDNLLVQIEFALNNMNDFLVTVDSLPKMSKELNSARKKVAHILTEFSKKLEVSVLLGKEVNKNISS